MVLMWTNPFRGLLEGVGAENQDFFGPEMATSEASTIRNNVIRNFVIRNFDIRNLVPVPARILCQLSVL
jgi:hypothetical protein